MSEQRDPNRTLTGAGIVAIGVLVFAALYVLSCGPAIRLYTRSNLSWHSYGSIYYPVLWAAGEWEPLHKLFDMYVNWWDQ